MNQKQLEIFNVLADTLNFTRTAEQLYLSQTTVTLQIHNLEEELNVKLFERTSRSVRLTPAGAAFRSGAKQILELIEKTVESTNIVAKGYTGLLGIGFANESNATGISNMIRAFIEEYPDIRLQIHGGYPGELLNLLAADVCDVIMTPSFNRLRSGNLCNHKIGHYDLVAAFNKDHAFRKRKSLRYEDFEEEKFIYISNPAAELDFTAEFFHQLEVHGVHADTFAKTDNIDSVFLMLDANMAVTVLPEYFDDRFSSSSNIRTCKLDGGLSGTDFLATWKYGKQTKEQELFIEFLKSYFPDMAERR